MTKQVLITGASGFAGRHMCEYLAAKEHRPRIIGVDISCAPSRACDAFFNADLSSSVEIAKVLEETRPECIIHLAGKFGADDPQAVYRANVLSMSALLESARRFTPGAVIVAAGSAAEWGRVKPEQLPITEATPCQPVTPYGLSKHLAMRIAMYYHRVHNTCVMTVRPFQLIGEGVPAQLAPGAFAEQLKRTLQERSRIIRVGNLETYRDFLDVRDAVRAIWMLCEKPAAGESFNLCSGKPTKMGELLQMMIKSCGVDISIEVDPGRLRGGAEIERTYGSFEKLKAHSTWEPRIDLEQSVRDMLRI